MSLLQDDSKKLIGNQPKLDANNSGDDAGDFKLLRKKKFTGGVSNTEKTDPTSQMKKILLGKYGVTVSNKIEEIVNNPTKMKKILLGTQGSKILESMKNVIETNASTQRVSKQEGGPMMMDEPVSLPEEQEQDMVQEEPMLPKAEPMMDSDEEMEDEYLDFILDEALDEEEEDFLMNQLEANEELSIIFDKVIEVASEFAGSGPVIGPGSGVSDSIPARLSDGEFVFTAKSVDEIGADNLMAMMKDAEMKADDRQGLANGGEPEEDTVEMEVEKPATKQDIRVVKTTVDNGGKGIRDEDEISKSIKSKMMLDNRTGRHVQS